MRDTVQARAVRPESAVVFDFQPFWKRESRYSPEALAGTFAAKSARPEAAEKLVSALSQIVCDGQKPSAAYNFLYGFKQNPGPLEMRSVQVEFEYEYLDARRANGILFHVLAPAAKMDLLIPPGTEGAKARPLPEKDMGCLQRALEKMTRESSRPAHTHVRPAFWLGDLCERITGISTRVAPRDLAAGVFDRDTCAFVSPDKDLIGAMLAVSREFYPVRENGHDAQSDAKKIERNTYAGEAPGAAIG